MEGIIKILLEKTDSHYYSKLARPYVHTKVRANLLNASLLLPPSMVHFFHRGTPVAPNTAHLFQQACGQVASFLLLLEVRAAGPDWFFSEGM